MNEPERNWPAWYYGPGGKSAIFQSADEVPAGWTDHPSKVGTEDGGVDGEKLGTTGVAGEPVMNTNADGEEVDKSGWPWDGSRNTANKGQTASGLWQLLPGQSRPAPKPGYPKETEKNFDL